MEQTKLLKVIYITIALVLLVSGFIVGYIYSNYGKTDNTLTSAIGRVNNLNGAYFTCSCVSNKKAMVTFTFTEDGIGDAFFWR